jgi:hypothetical protein
MTGKIIFEFEQIGIVTAPPWDRVKLVGRAVPARRLQSKNRRARSDVPYHRSSRRVSWNLQQQTSASSLVNAAIGLGPLGLSHRAC